MNHKTNMVAVLLSSVMALIAIPFNVQGEIPSLHRPASAQAVRFVATSPDFELVGFVEGKKLTLWIDHVKTNIPVVSGTIEMEIGEIKIQPQKAGDAWVSILPAELASGTLAVTAIVTTAGTTDLLAGEVLQTVAPMQTTPEPGRRSFFGLWAIAGLVAILGGAVVLRRRLSRSDV